MTSATDSEGTLGNPIPPFTQHAISVSLPTWADNVAYEEGHPRVMKRMETGYPRFFVHLSIQKLAAVCEKKFGTPSERAMLFPSRRTAEACRDFVSARDVPARVVQCSADGVHVFAVLFPADKFSVAKQFWQHSGLGVSSRLAERCLAALSRTQSPVPSPQACPAHARTPAKASNKHYAPKRACCASPAASPRSAAQTNGHSLQKGVPVEEEFDADHAVYLEERYGRNLNSSAASKAKNALRRRIAGVLVKDESRPDASVDEEVDVGSVRGVAVTESDVYLYPSGMGAIWSAHQLALATRGQQKSVCFGFPYTDTLKILEKWGPGCYFLGHGLDSSIDELETILSTQLALEPSRPPVLALFTEFPSNPLLRSANLPRLRALADQYDFLLVVDDTIGNFLNVEVLPYADIVVTSLTKLFSGESNVMGGSLVLNPARKHYAALKAKQLETYEDNYFDEDAIFMERNSRDFATRVKAVDANAERVCDFLYAAAQAPNSVLTSVFYPKWQTAANYDLCRIKPHGGYGGLFSVSFASMAAAQGFFDTLPIFKGPSLGTNFTLACPYTILAHYLELEWAAGYGVPDTLVRVSVGLEESEVLMRGFAAALKAAEEAHCAAGGR
ncbi:PLP-dependent transferase [Artomyces pyxidatus]|uniref:PLP-dependent transferase n=1 Tax=Artomyces pyxidatus TaxID=48021 RepID=A0ACB8T7V7_9AGAM|nr:PLP-dependent transferase [Artomyces pyxidatus]